MARESSCSVTRRPGFNKLTEGFSGMTPRWLFGLLGALCIPALVCASELMMSDLEDRFDGLQANFEDLSEQFDEFSSDDTIVRSGTSKSSMSVVGRVHADYWAFPNTDPGIDLNEGGPQGPQTRFGFRRVRFGVRGDLPANMEYRIEMEFAGGNRIEFRDVWLGWNELPILRTLLIGNQKRAYGLDHLNSSRYNVFMERPFVIESFNQDARRLGIASYGFSESERWSWRYGVYNLRLVQDEGNYTNDDLQLEFAWRVANTIWYDEVSRWQRICSLGRITLLRIARWQYADR